MAWQTSFQRRPKSPHVRSHLNPQQSQRFHQTLKRFLNARPPARSLPELQHQLDQLREHYNEHRPHRARDRTTPGKAYRATPKALPANPRPAEAFRLRYDRVDATGSISLRHAGTMHHAHIGRTHAGTRILAIIDDHTITITRIDTGEIISTNTIDPTRNYWPNTMKAPGRWPEASKQ